MTRGRTKDGRGVGRRCAGLPEDDDDFSAYPLTSEWDDERAAPQHTRQRPLYTRRPPRLCPCCGGKRPADVLFCGRCLSDSMDGLGGLMLWVAKLPTGVVPLSVTCGRIALMRNMLEHALRLPVADGNRAHILKAWGPRLLPVAPDD